ncbi:6,7-dimethyl-8-ribityllumazine synthase [Candidatus Methylocalor cossyra]|uniref:6,7-dimethyl-8-ribityllumazine synthase n=1 Tax=Candidatus Methylocalor cossyra TaxID=3108543 RepID=A0ABM9NLD3_9GAMM
MEIKTYQGQLSAQNARFCLIVSRFNAFIVDQLEAGALDALLRHGAKPENVHRVQTPGAFELPLAAERAAASGRYDAIVALGAVVRGATPHFDYVAGECVKGLSAVALKYGLPVTLGVLTVDSLEQAIERAGTKAGNKGAEAALSAIEMVDLLRAMAAE